MLGRAEWKKVRKSIVVEEQPGIEAEMGGENTLIPTDYSSAARARPNACAGTQKCLRR